MKSSELHILSPQNTHRLPHVLRQCDQTTSIYIVVLLVCDAIREKIKIDIKIYPFVNY